MVRDYDDSLCEDHLGAVRLRGILHARQADPQ